MQSMHLEYLKRDCTRPHLTNKPFRVICVMYQVQNSWYKLVFMIETHM